MPQIYRKTSLDGKHKTHIFYCGDCLDQSWLDKDDDGAPKHFTGRWEEAPLEMCDVCGAVDQESRDEYDNWAEELNQQQWEEEQEEYSYLGKTPGTPEWEEASQLRDLMNKQEYK